MRSLYWHIRITVANWLASDQEKERKANAVAWDMMEGSHRAPKDSWGVFNEREDAL